jgi:DNA-binding CsgD family transcriptional regulator
MSTDDGGDLLAKLTSREREVLDLVRAGLTNGEIGERLGISADGAKYHVSQIIRKLDVRNRHEAARWPEKPGAWTGAPALIGVLWRWAQAKAGGMALVASGAVLAVAVVGLGLLALVLWSNDQSTSGDEAQFPEGISWQEAEQAAQAPIFLDEPVRISGDGWSLESRVENLGELEVIGLAEAWPNFALSLVDMHHGRSRCRGSISAQLCGADHPRSVETRGGEHCR